MHDCPSCKCPIPTYRTSAAPAKESNVEPAKESNVEPWNLKTPLKVVFISIPVFAVLYMFALGAKSCNDNSVSVCQKNLAAIHKEPLAAFEADWFRKRYYDDGFTNDCSLYESIINSRADRANMDAKLRDLTKNK